MIKFFQSLRGAFLAMLQSRFLGHSCECRNRILRSRIRCGMTYYMRLIDLFTMKLLIAISVILHALVEARKLLRISGALIIIAALSSCGFKPMYGERNSVLPIKISSITMANAEVGKLEYIMRKELKSQFDPSGFDDKYDYKIAIVLHKSILSFDTQSNRVSSRQRIDMRANFIVKDLNDKKIIEDFVIASDSFYVSTSPYSSLVSEEETVNLLAKTLAQEISLRVASSLGAEQLDN